MKKLFNLALFGAIALTGAVGFSSCSSSSDEVIDNPDYNPETNIVKTEFTISLPNNVVSKTRMSSTDVQNAGYTDFRGMTSIFLLPFSTTVTTTNYNTEAATVHGSAVKLGDIVKSSPTSTEEELNSTANNSVVYEDIPVQTSTSSFIFYAKASGEKATRDQADKFKLGSLNPLVGTAALSENITSVSNLTFSLEQITTNTTQCVGSVKGAAIITLLNQIEQTTDNDATSPRKWEDALDASLGGLHATFKTMKAGSSKCVEAALGKLYHTLKTYSDGAAGSNKEIADNIRSKISAACSTAPAADATSITLSDTYQGYPADVFLPDGAARLNWTASATDKFSGMSSGDTDFGKFANPTAYTFPASLYYWTNSPLVAANEKKSTSYSTKTSWAEVVSTAEGGVYKDAVSSVSSSTRSIALVNQIQYAVGRLDTYVKIASTGTDLVTLKDDENTTVNLPSGGFVLTGVLIGSQRTAGWNFEPKSATSDQYTIYDRDVISGISASSATLSGPNYTLVLETVANDNVTVALEFQNGTQEFKGADGYIPAGSKFYLLAELKPKLSTDGGNADDPTKTENKVFKQDYKTIANFTIGANSLAKAYNTLPDLRKPDLELGLSVNLEWQTGITFNVDF